MKIKEFKEGYQVDCGNIRIGLLSIVGIKWLSRTDFALHRDGFESPDYEAWIYVAYEDPWPVRGYNCKYLLINWDRVECIKYHPCGPINRWRLIPGERVKPDDLKLIKEAIRATIGRL